jgi:hypothetical protein
VECPDISIKPPKTVIVARVEKIANGNRGRVRFSGRNIGKTA